MPAFHRSAAQQLGRCVLSLTVNAATPARRTDCMPHSQTHAVDVNGSMRLRSV